MDERIKSLINQIKAHLIKMKMALNGCGCAARIGCVERKTINETSSATIKRNTQPSDWLVIKV